MKRTLRRTALMPIWLWSRILQPYFPRSHPWRKEKLTLAWWERGATDDALWLSVMMGIVFVSAVALMVNLLWRWW